MSSAPRTDGGDDGADAGELWERVGRKAAAMELEGARHDADAVLYDVTVETMLEGAEPTPEQVRAARRALNDQRRILEQYVAPAAECEPWGEPVPDMPPGRYREIVDCPCDDGREDADE